MLVMTLVTIPLMDRAGRRTLHLVNIVIVLVIASPSPPLSRASYFYIPLLKCLLESLTTDFFRLVLLEWWFVPF